MNGARPARDRRTVAFAGFVANGLFAQLAQILLLRELLVVLDGDELALGLMLAAWLVWVGIGAGLGGWAVRRHAGLSAYVVVVTLAAVSLPPVLAAIRLCRPTFDAPLGTPLGLPAAALLAVASSAIPCLSVGVLFPLMVRTSAARPALVYGGEALGALGGGLLFVFVLVEWLSPLTIAALAGLVMLAAATWRAACVGRSSRSTIAALVGVSALLIGGVAIGGPLDRLTQRLCWQRLLPTHELLESSESPYGRCAVLRAAGQTSLFVDGSPVCDVPDPWAGVFVTHTTLLQVDHPEQVLIIGHGLLGDVREALRHGPTRVDCVELDRRPLELLARHVPADCSAVLGAPAVRVHHDDPTRFLRQAERGYDAILIDLPDPSTLGINRFYTSELLARAAGRLRPGGVLALTLSSQENYLGPALRARNALIYHAVRAVLPEAVATPGDTCLIVARRPGGAETRLTLDVDELESRAKRRKLNSLEFTALLYSDPFPRERVRAVNRSLADWPADENTGAPSGLSDGPDEPFVPPPINQKVAHNTDVQPRAYWATRLLNAEKFEPSTVPLVRAMPAVCRWSLGGLWLASAAGLVLARMKRASPHPGLPLTVAAAGAGFGIMALQVLMILWYQSRAGQLYVDLALLTAMFMAGLAAGSLLGSRGTAARRTLLIAQATMLLLGLVLPWALGNLGLWARPVSATLAAGLGGLLGLHFACCTRLWPRGAPTIDARWLYCADVIGAALAAALVPAVIVPVSGFDVAATWATAFCGLALAASLSLRRDAAPQDHPRES